MKNVSPYKVFKQVSEAVPTQYHKNIIIVGSLAVGYHFFGKKPRLQIRTKDIDCVLSPRIEAVDSGEAIAQKLLDEGWKPLKKGDFIEPGNENTPDDKLPAIRLYPPGKKEWFLEFLTVPESEDEHGKNWVRIKLKSGHYGLCSFKYILLTNYQPLKTEFGIKYARPEMMALANLFEHPEIKPETMSSLIEERAIKRSNKDLGRVLSIAHLSSDTEVEEWPEAWIGGIKSCFPSQWKELVPKTGLGIRALLNSELDLEEAQHTCNYGLLASQRVTIDQLIVIGKRLLQDAIEPFEKLN